MKNNLTDLLALQQAISKTHPEWRALLKEALATVDEEYFKELKLTPGWLPGWDRLLAAFSHPLNRTKYVLIGESPYPRKQSANGYAFWDNAVGVLWGPKGLSKEVNRATSLRNWIKMLLVARGELQEDQSQSAIAKLDKTAFCQTAKELFESMMEKGFLLLNASLVYSQGRVNFHARHWQPFLNHLLSRLTSLLPSVQLILLGNIAKKIPQAAFFSCLLAEHPYNLSFINNKDVLDFFKPLDLLHSNAYVF